MNAYRVIADWGQDDEGDYCTYVWADYPEEAEILCFAEMNAAYNHAPDRVYDVTYCETLEEFIRQSEGEIAMARTFLANVVQT